MQENTQKATVVKDIRKTFEDKIKSGIIWFKLISAINDIKLTPRELQLLSFINTRGTISSSSAKGDFCRMFDSSTGTISNMIGTLSSLKLLVKDKNKIKINPSLRVDFNSDLVVRFFIHTKEEEIEYAD